MYVQELGRKFHRVTPWRAAVVFSMLLLAIAFLAELFLHPSAEALSLLGTAELSALLVLFIDLGVNFSRAESKVKFLKQNWFELLLFMPFSFAFEALRAYEAFEIMGLEAMPFLMRTRILVKSGHVASVVNRSPPLLMARQTIYELTTAPERYRTLRYRGLLRVS
jgi:hypothetical protein